ncbi:hypothetical protein pb186bvf_005455 [Paramecium bursaria]
MFHLFLIIAAQAQFLVPVESEQEICYGVIFDAGSSGTRVYIYNWECRTIQTWAYVNISQSAPNKNVRPGLATYFDKVDQIQEYLQPLLDYANSLVPSNLTKYTPIMLGATAGLRTLDIKLQTGIMNQVKTIFKASGYLYQSEWVRVLTGQEEGAYLWMTYDYLLNKTQSNLLTIDLGGASTQIGFPFNTTQDDFPINIPPNISNYNLYVVSYLGYGNDLARTAVLKYNYTEGSNKISTPCFPVGYLADWDQNVSVQVEGTGNLQECQKLIVQYLNVSTGTSINGGYQPQVTNQTIYAASGVVTMASLFNVQGFNLPQFYIDITEFSALTYQEAQAKYPGNSFIGTNFFLGAYVYELLSTGYGIPDNQYIYAPPTIGSIQPSWTLAGCSYQLAQINCNYDSPFCQTFGLGYLSILILIIIQ